MFKHASEQDEASTASILNTNKPGLIAPTMEKAMEKLQNDLKRMPMTVAPPSRGKLCPWTGLPKSSFYQLIAPCRANNGQPPVFARYVKAHRRAKRGRWIIRSEDLLRYWYGIPDEGLVEESNRSMAAATREGAKG